MIKTLRAKLRRRHQKKQRQYQTPHMHWLFPFYFNQSIRSMFPHIGEPPYTGSLRFRRWGKFGKERL